MPMMAFMAVRISWLMEARNSLLARLAASAASLARRSSSATRRSSVMSSLTATKWVISPCSSVMGEIEARSQYFDPSFFRLQNTPRHARPSMMVCHISV